MEEVKSEDVLSDQNVSEPYNLTQEDVKFQEDLDTLMTIGKIKANKQPIISSIIYT